MASLTRYSRSTGPSAARPSPRRILGPSVDVRDWTHPPFEPRLETLPDGPGRVQTELMLRLALVGSLLALGASSLVDLFHGLGQRVVRMPGQDHVDPGNAAALHLYLGLGYRPTGAADPAFSCMAYRTKSGKLGPTMFGR